MNRDFKFLAEPKSLRKPGRKASLRKPQKHHILAFAAITVLVITFFYLTPDNASANRQNEPQILVLPELTQDQSHSQSHNQEKAESMVTTPWQLPPDRQPLQTNNDLTTKPEPKGTWHTVKVKRGDNLAQIFSRLKISPDQLHAIMQLGKTTRRLKRLYPGETFKVRISKGENSLQHQLEELVYQFDVANSLQILNTNEGFHAQKIKKELEVRHKHVVGHIKHSLFLAGQRAGMSDNLTMELASIFGWDIDFALDIRKGDNFAIIHEELFLDGKKVKNGNIIAADFTNNGKTYRAVLYTNSKGRADYFTPKGNSMRKAFLRTPVEFSRISSRYGMRRHPTLNRMRAHKGVDYAAPRGTPIRATGDGKIVHRARKGGYGKVVIIRHGNRYQTLYAHMSNYNRKARLGKRVKQGQIIGYVGSTGRATGPHLHYEFRVYGVHRNPLKVRLPQAAPIAKKYKKDFMKKIQPLIAQLELLNNSLIALKQP